MINEELLQTFPSKRIKPIDGMAVTSDVWEEAHNYHRYLNQFHTLLYHGTGIVIGLEVIASDPPDALVYIMPGIAVDGYGRAIVVPQAVGFNFDKKAEGLLHLVLSYDESRPRAAANNQPDGPLYIHEYFSVEALPNPPSTGVELARLRRVGRDAPLLDAPDALHPGSNEIDLRFRRIVGETTQRIAPIAVSYLGEAGKRQHGQGATLLARSLANQSVIQAQVDDDVPLARELSSYALVVLVGNRAFQLKPEEIQNLRTYLKGGGTIFAESCRQHGNAQAAEQSFSALFKELEVALKPIPTDHALLHEPHLFATPPAGYETEGSVQVGGGVIYSTFDYGCLWLAQQRNQTPSREVIRSALEWGHNLLDYALDRRSETRREQRRARGAQTETAREAARQGA